jgi:ankyrin repeat protein
MKLRKAVTLFLPIVVTLAIFTISVTLNRGQKARFGSRDIDGQLSMAAWEGNITRMKSLIAKGADVNATCCGRIPPMHAAAFGGHNKAIVYLLEQGANVDIGGKFNETALMIAVSEGHYDTAKLLIEKGANVNAYDEAEYATPLKLAIVNGHKKIISLLQKHDAKENPTFLENLLR